jgi:mannose-6-phosphate isomerase-like protein (cupin superfamily)
MSQGRRGDAEDLVVRFGDLARRRSPYRPPDMALPRYERERYAVVGRPAEGSDAAPPVGADAGFSVVYLKCEPGTGVAMHAHASSEVFIAMSGRWAATLEGGERVELEAWDLISVPPDTMHGLENIGTEPAYVMAINSGSAGAPIRLPPELLREIAAAGGHAEEVTRPGETAPR